MSLSRNPAPVQRNASPFLHDIPLLCKSQWNSGANWHATRPWKGTFWSSPQRQGHRSRIRTLANGCGRLRTVADGCERLRTVANGCEHKNNDRRTQLYPQTPKVKREPFATHSGKCVEDHLTIPSKSLSSDWTALLSPPMSILPQVTTTPSERRAAKALSAATTWQISCSWSCSWHNSLYAPCTRQGHK